MQPRIVRVTAFLTASFVLLGVCPQARAEASYTGPLTVKLLGAISARGNKKGDKIAAEVVTPSRFAGGVVEGDVVEAKAAGKVNGTSSLNLAFRTLNFDGAAYRMSCSIKGFQNSKGQRNVDEEGRVVKHNGGAGQAILGGMAGAAIGAATGGASGAVIGAASGVAAVVLIKLAVKAPSIEFEPGSQVFLQGSVKPMR